MEETFMGRFWEVSYDVMFGLSLIFRCLIAVAVISWKYVTVSMQPWVVEIAFIICALCYVLYPLFRSIKEAKRD